jgi:hypothetical protein
VIIFCSKEYCFLWGGGVFRFMSRAKLHRAWWHSEPKSSPTSVEMEQEREPPRTGSTTTTFTTTWATRTQIRSRSGHPWADLRTFLTLADAALVAHLPKLVRAFFPSFLLLQAHRAAAALENFQEICTRFTVLGLHGGGGY